LLLVLSLLLGLEGTLIASAFLAESKDPLLLAQGFQPFIAAIISVIAAAFVYISAMSKTWQDRDAKLSEQKGLALAIDGEVSAAVSELFFLAAQTKHLAANLEQEDPTHSGWTAFFEQGDTALIYCREHLHECHADKIGELTEKKTMFTKLLGTARDTRALLDRIRKDPGTGDRATKLAKVAMDRVLTNVMDLCIREAQRYPSLKPDSWPQKVAEIYEKTDQHMDEMGFSNA
jgi:hypothetical protein